MLGGVGLSSVQQWFHWSHNIHRLAPPPYFTENVLFNPNFHVWGAKILFFAACKYQRIPWINQKKENSVFFGESCDFEVSGPPIPEIFEEEGGGAIFCYLPHCETQTEKVEQLSLASLLMLMLLLSSNLQQEVDQLVLLHLAAPPAPGQSWKKPK